MCQLNTFVIHNINGKPIILTIGKADSTIAITFPLAFSDVELHIPMNYGHPIQHSWTPVHYKMDTHSKQSWTPLQHT